MARRLLGLLVLVAGCLDPNPDFMGVVTDMGSSGPSMPTSSATIPSSAGDTTDDPPATDTASTLPGTTTTGMTATTSGETTEGSETSAASTGGPVCGDGKLELGEDCDDGDGDDLDECGNDCISAYCGDGKLHGKEQCDDGDMDDSDDCLTNCKTAKCGDGSVYIGFEQCDDANKVKWDACEEDCKISPKLVFLSSKKFSPSELGGLDGADERCNELAMAVLLPGKFRAWLSGGEGSPSTRMTQADVPYVLIDGVSKVADDWDDLMSGDLKHPIDRTEKMGFAQMGDSCSENGVYTNTKPDGTLGTFYTSCGEWNANEGQAWLGSPFAKDMAWSDAKCMSGACTQKASIYCFQQ